jgi:hypothetical protein
VSEHLFGAVRRGLTKNTAYTAADSGDRRLRGRTYAIPFDTVWQAALGLVDGGLRGWSVLAADDKEGVIEGAIHGRIRRFNSAVTIRVSLDRDAQTRVDGLAAAVTGQADLGTNARRLARFFRSLDRAIESASGRPIGNALIEPASWK